MEQIPTLKRQSRGLIVASYSCHLKVVNFLCEHGASVEAADTCGRQSLFFVSIRDRTKVVQQLLSRGAVVDTKGRYGSIPFFAAVQHGHETAVSSLYDL